MDKGTIIIKETYGYKKDVNKMDTSKIKDYITTVTLAALPVIVAYQAQIGAYVPVEYALIFTLVIGIASQLSANARVKEAFNDTSAGIDEGQAKLAELQAKLVEAQTTIDAKQAEIEKVVGLKEMTEEPVLD